MVSFRVPEVEDNEDGWGPVSVPEHLAGVPYAPFGKGDKVGRISDFTAAAGKYGGDELTVAPSCDRHTALLLAIRAR